MCFVARSQPQHTIALEFADHIQQVAADQACLVARIPLMNGSIAAAGYLATSFCAFSVLSLSPLSVASMSICFSPFRWYSCHHFSARALHSFPLLSLSG